MGYIMPMQYINPIATEKRVNYKRKDTKITKPFQAALNTKYEELNKENRRGFERREQITPKKKKQPRLNNKCIQYLGDEPYKGVHFCKVI